MCLFNLRVVVQGTEAEVAKIAYEYVLAIQWICHYYYNGVQSWSW